MKITAHLSLQDVQKAGLEEFNPIYSVDENGNDICEFDLKRVAAVDLLRRIAHFARYPQ